MAQLPTYVFENEFGSVTYRADARLLEIRWFDTTAEMTSDGFKVFLQQFADAVERFSAPRVLVDATAFRTPREHMIDEWRDANIIPRYSGAGVQRFAFHMPAGMPLVGRAPAKEGPATFPTAYFDSRRSAMGWLFAA
jgi:hypothetical protein